MDCHHDDWSIASSSSFLESTFAGLAISKPIEACVQTTLEAKPIAEHEDQFQLPAPVMCTEDRLAVEVLMSSSDSSDCDLGKELEHEVPQSSKSKCEKPLAVDVSKPKVQTGKPTWRRKNKKKKKKRSKKPKAFGRQHGKSNDYHGKKDTKGTENCNHGGEGVCGNNPRKANYQGRGPSREFHGDDSDSDDEKRRRDPKLPRGHYAGIQQQEDEPMSVESHQNRLEEISETAPLVAQERCAPEVCQLLDPQEVGFQRILEHKSQGIDLANIPALISKKCIHCSHSTNCDNCMQPDLCKLVKGLIGHYRLCPQKDIQCKCCQFVICGVMQHAINCDNNNCQVPDCEFYRNSLQFRNRRKSIEGKVIYSVTSIFKEGQSVHQDVDYAYLHKQKLGHGTHGDVYRVWLYHLMKEVEADIVVKEVKYDPEDEARIHQVIRCDHPNLLGALMVVRFPSLWDVGNGKKLHGYIFMERGECTLFELKKRYREKHGCGLPMQDAVYYLRQTLDGIRFLHDKKIVHKDIKDMNVMLFEENQRVKIADWDGALFIENEMSAADLKPVGTPGFCAPEVLEKKPHGFPADIFSTAIMFLELRYGGQYKSRAEISYEPVLQRRREALERLQQEHPKLGELIKKCLADDPAERPTALQLVDHPLLAYEQNYKVNLPLRSNSGGNDFESADFCQYADLAGEVGDRIRTHVAHLSRQNDSQISLLMDQLPKSLPTENVPQSSDWIGAATVEEASEQSEPVEMDTT